MPESTDTKQEAGTVSNSSSTDLLAGFILTPVPPTGPVEIARDKVSANFRKAKISQYGGEFRIYSDDYKVTLSPSDASWIIDKMRLTPERSEIFTRSITWS